MSFIHCSRCSLQVAKTTENADYYFGFGGKTPTRFKTCKRCSRVVQNRKDKKRNSSSDESNDTEETPTQSEEVYYSSDEADSHFVKVTQIGDTVSRAEFIEALNDNRVVIIRKKS